MAVKDKVGGFEVKLGDEFTCKETGACYLLMTCNNEAVMHRMDLDAKNIPFIDFNFSNYTLTKRRPRKVKHEE